MHVFTGPDWHGNVVRAIPGHGPSPQAVTMPGGRSGMGGAGQRWHENCFAGYKHGALGVRDEYRPLNCRLHPVGVVSAGWRSPPAQTRRKTPFCSGLKPAMSLGIYRRVCAAGTVIPTVESACSH
jgi:hypothetical protein